MNDNASDEWEVVQQKRRQQIKEGCDKIYPDPDKKTPLKPTFQMLVDTRHKVMFCYIPKVACTSWKGVLCQMMKEGVTSTTEQLLSERKPGWPYERIHFHLQECGLKSLNKLTKDEQATVFANYTKIIAVRDPIQRILSLYKNKFYSTPGEKKSCQFCSAYGKGIIQRYRYTSQNATQDHLRITIDEFIRFVLKPYVINEHWQSYQDLCHPCHIEYDYICKMETLHSDAPRVLTTVFNSTLPFPFSNPSKNATFKDNFITPEEEQNLIKRFKNDINIFGYRYEQNMS